MAVTAREVIMVFRGQNYLSSAIRKVGADVGGLSRGAQLTQQRAQLQIAQQRAMLTRSTAAQEIVSIQNGARRLTQDKAVAAQAVASTRAGATLLNQQTRLTQMQRVTKQRGSLPGFTKAESADMIKAQRMQVEASTAAVANQSLATQKLTADETRLAEREAQLTQQRNIASRSIELYEEKLVQLDLVQNKMLNTQKWQGYAQSVEHAGRVVQMFGLIAAASFGFAADQAAKFNTQAVIAAAKVKQPGMTTGNIQQFGTQIQQGVSGFLVSGKAVSAPTDLTTSVYRILSGLQLPGKGVQQIKEALSLMKQFQTVVKANFGFVDMNQVTAAGITVMRDFNIQLKDVPKALNTMQAAEKYGRLTMGEFTATLSQAAPAARAAGYSLKDMAATIAFLSTKFPQAQQGAVGYARLLQLFAQNAVKFNVAGYQVSDKSGKNLLPLTQIIDNIVKKNPELVKGGIALQNFFKTITGQSGYIRSRQVFTFLAQDAKGLSLVTKQVTGDTTVLAKSAATAGKSPAVAWAEFKNQMRGIIIEIGTGAIPAFQALAKPIEAVFRWFNKLSPSAQHLIGYIGALVAVGALLVGTFAAVGGGIASMILSFQLWRIASAAAAAGTGVLEAEVAVLGSEVGAVTVEMAGLLAVALALALLFKYGFGGHNSLQTLATIPGSGGEKTIVQSDGKFYERTRTATRGSQRTLGPQITAAQAQAAGGNVNVPDKAIQKAIADSPRYQHAIGANQKAVNAFSAALAREAAAQRLANLVGDTAGVKPVHIRSVQSWIALLEKAHAAALGSPSDLLKAERYEKLLLLLNTQFKSQPVLLSAINDVLSSYDSNLKQTTADANTLGTTFQDVLTSMTGMYNTFLSQEQTAFGTLFSGPFVNSPQTQNRLQWGGLLTGKDLLKDIKSQVSQFTNFHRQIAQLTKMGAPYQLIKQIQALGPDALSQTDAFGKRRKSLVQQLMGLPPSQLKAYFDTFTSGQKLVQDAALKDLTSQLDQYRKYGRNIALAIVAGLRDENVTMTKALTGIIHNMFPGLPVGATGAGGKPTHHPAHSTHTVVHHDYHVTVKPGTDIKTQVKHADFARRNRYTGRGPGPR